MTIGLLVLGLLALGSARLVTTALAPTAAASAVSLVDDDGGAALFSSAGLSPGRVESACVGLTASGSVDPATEVALNADVTAGGLSPYLQVWVERGTVPAGGTCGAFAGAVLWSGTLDRFPVTGTTGIATGWRPAVTQRSVYRFTVTVVDDPRAETLSTSATFRWSFTEAAPLPPVAPSPTAAPPTTVAPGPSTAPRSTVGSAAVTSGESVVVPTEPTPPTMPPPTPPTMPPPTPLPPSSSAPVPTADGGSDRVVEAPPLETGPAAAVQAALAAAGEVAAGVGRTAQAVARNGQYPLALVVVVAAFLFLQGRLDRRDPKLALARVREELSEYRDFPEPPRTETT